MTGSKLWTSYTILAQFSIFLPTGNLKKPDIFSEYRNETLD